MNTLWTGLRSLLPSVEDYRGLRRSWRADAMAGVTVGIVALPLALAFGISSGAGAEAGLITAIVAGLVAAVFGGSNVQVSGPTGAMVVVLAPIVAAHGVGAVAIVSLLAGVIVLIAGALRLGRSVALIPWPVIEGFTVGIGVIIFLQQVPAALGATATGHSTNAAFAAAQTLTEALWPQALLPLGAVAAVALIMVALSRFAPRLPASFLAIIVVTLASAGLGLPLATIGELPSTLPVPGLPPMSGELVLGLLGPALAVAALAAIESLLSARVAASMGDVGTVDADRELVGQGLASIASGLFGGMPATGAIARTAVNVRSGARTRLAAIVHALALLAVVGLAASLVSHVPLAALAGVLMVTAVRMISPRIIARIMRSTRSDAAVFALTAIITISVDLIVAVGLGMAVAAVLALRSLSAASGVHREALPAPAMPGDERIAVFRIDGALFFGAAERLLDSIRDHHDIDVVILRLSQMQIVDATGANTLAELVSGLRRRGVVVLIKGVRPEHRALLEQLGAIAALESDEHLFTELPQAIEHAREHIARAQSI